MNSKISALLACGAFAIYAYSAESSIAVSSAQLHKGNARVDVLGRHNANVRSTPTAAVNAKKSIKDKHFFAKSYVTPNYPYSEPELSTFSGSYTNRLNTRNQKVETYKWNGDVMDKDEYAYASFMREKYEGIREKYANGEIDDLIGFTETSDKRKLWPSVYLNQNSINQNYLEFKELANLGNIDNDNSLYHSAVARGKKGNNIGIYVQQKAIPSDGLGLQFEQLNGCDGTHGSSEKYRDMYYASEPIRILNETSSKAKVYVMDSDCGPSGSSTNLRSGARQPNNPQNYAKKLFVGLHTSGKGSDYNYNTIAQDIDDYTYFNRVIQIAAAGNTTTNIVGENNFISDYAKGANVITVGAIKPVHYGNSYLSNSDWHNTHISSTREMDKPEVANISNIFIKTAKGGTFSNDVNQYYRFNYPSVTGTEGAATLTAGQVVDLLDTVPFFKWHPEVVKALLISASEKEISNGQSYDGDFGNYKATKYPNMENMIYGNRARFWIGNNADHFSDEEITFEEKDIVLGRTYRIAISWLSRGKYIMEYHKLPQDIDLEVCQETTCKRSQSVDNPFEIVEFTATTAKPLKIKISRFRNDGGYVILGYNMHEIYSTPEIH